MNVHDEANNLAKALKESNEYKTFKEAEEKLKAHGEYFEMAKEYAQKQMGVQTRQMMGQELSEEEIETYNSMTTTILGIPEIAEYFQAQMYFGIVFQDVMDIIGKAVDLDMGMFGSEDDE
ncbi:MAG: YlbF family regulator [Eubacterium sp.]